MHKFAKFILQKEGRSSHPISSMFEKMGGAGGEVVGNKYLKGPSQTTKFNLIVYLDEAAEVRRQGTHSKPLPGGRYHDF